MSYEGVNEGVVAADAELAVERVASARATFAEKRT
jgi:hypothetical protein